MSSHYPPDTFKDTPKMKVVNASYIEGAYLIIDFKKKDRSGRDYTWSQGFGISPGDSVSEPLLGALVDALNRIKQLEERLDSLAELVLENKNSN